MGSLTEAEIEKKKDRFDLQPTLKYVEENLPKYRQGLARFTAKYVAGNVMRYACINTDQLDEAPQVVDSQISLILGSLPRAFTDLSLLETVDYAHNRIVPFPLFGDEGNWRGVDFVRSDEFPRTGQHPGRILIGRSDGKTIFPSALPESVCLNEEARWYYQLHVFLHEFFHTIEYLRRTPAVRERVVLACRGSVYTFQQWWRTWEDDFSSVAKRTYPTAYSAVYADDLTMENRVNNYDIFTRAVAEQVCESFVGYILGIVPTSGDDGRSFQDRCPMAWLLMDSLADSIVAQK